MSKDILYSQFITDGNTVTIRLYNSEFSKQLETVRGLAGDYRDIMRSLQHKYPTTSIRPLPEVDLRDY